MVPRLGQGKGRDELVKRTWHYYLALMAVSASWLTVLAVATATGVFLAVLLLYAG